MGNRPQPMDTQAIARVWEMNIESQRQVVVHLKSNEGAVASMMADNQYTRLVVACAAMVVLVASVFMSWRTMVILDQSTIILRSVQEVTSRLTAIEGQQRMVLGVVNASIEAQHAEEEWRDAERQLALKHIAVSSSRKRRKPTVKVETELVKIKTMVMKKKRRAAREASLKARDHFGAKR